MKGREERERYTQLNVEFQRTVKRDKKAFLNEKCKVWSSLQTGAWWTRVDEKREKKRERAVSLGLHGKPIKPMHRTFTTH